MKHHLPNPEKFTQGFYTPRFPEKYKGKLPIRCLSSWEFKVAHFFDNNPNIIAWSSETISIRYYHPIKQEQAGKPVMSNYFPDYLVTYIDKFGKKHIEIVEVKPLRQSVMEAAKSKKEKMDVMVNTAKWQAARIFAQQNGIGFRVITERDIFGGKIK